MFVECPAFRRAPRRPQSTNTAQQQRNLFKLMAMAAPVCQKKTVPPPAFCVHPLAPHHVSSIHRSSSGMSLALRCIFLASAISLPALRFCSSISSDFRCSSGLQSHAFIHSTPLIPLPSFPIFADLRQQPPRAPIFFIHFIRCTSSSQRSDAGRAELSVHRRGSHSSVRFSSKLAQGVQCVYLQQPQLVLF